MIYQQFVHHTICTYAIDRYNRQYFSYLKDEQCVINLLYASLIHTEIYIMVQI